MRTQRILLLALPLLATLSGCSSGPDVSEMPVQILTATPAQAQRTEVMPVEQILRPQDVLDVIFHIGNTSVGSYIVQPGDQVDLAFQSASELNGSKVVMPDGTIEMAYIGSIKVAGLTTDQAQGAIEKSFSKILKKPEMTFSVAHALAQVNLLRNSLNHPATGLSREIIVGDDGRASFPLIGSVSLQGKTLTELRKDVARRYNSEVGNFTVDIALKSTPANEVYVLGEVGAPGAYPIRRPISVLEALTLAKGASPKARLDSVVIMRRQGNQVEARVYDADAALDGKALNFAYLQPDDMLFVPKTRLAKAGELSRQIADVVLFQGVNASMSYRLDNKNDNSGN